MAERFTEIDYRCSGSVGRLTLGRPGRAVLTPTMLKELHRALDLVADERVRFLVVTGTGGTFCGGVDPDAARLAARTEHGYDRLVEDYLEPFAAFLARLRTAAEHVIAAVNGSCSAAGLWIVRACEFAVGPEPSPVLADQVEGLIDRLSRQPGGSGPPGPSAAPIRRPGVLR